MLQTRSMGDNGLNKQVSCRRELINSLTEKWKLNEEYSYLTTN